MKNKLLAFLKNNIMVFVWFALAVAIETFSVCFIGLSPVLTKPAYILVFFCLCLSILFLIRSPLAKGIVCDVLLLFQSVCQVGFVYLYDCNGTFFEWSMLKQRNDAFATIEELSLRWSLVAILILAIVLFTAGIILLHYLFYKKHPAKYGASKVFNITLALLLTTGAVCMVATPTAQAVGAINKSYVERYLYGDADNRYQQLGITGNTLYEFINGTMVDGIMKFDDLGVDEFIYGGEQPLLETSKYFGMSRNNNLIYILAESLEWYPFLQLCTKQQSAVLFPNLNKFFSNSIYANNYYSREKTDTAEMLSVVGSSPTGGTINYDFDEDELPWALPYLFRDGVESRGNTVVGVNSFHANEGSFYNRKGIHDNLGYDYFYAIEDMMERGMPKTWNQSGIKGERNLDTDVIKYMGDLMVPETKPGEQFMTYWITFAMHGFYVERENLRALGYYDLLDEVGAYPGGLSVKDDYLRTYAAAVMDFDRALGMLFDRLEETNQLDRTTIVIFGDHNTYYSNLSYYAKGIDNRYNPELYRVPFMLYDQKLVKAYEADNGTREISKFTTTSDMLPTILDIFGIYGYRNLYFGSSMFTDRESIVFSRSYGIFLTDKLMCYSAKNLLFTTEGFTQADYDDFIARATIHLNKLEVLDKIYHTNYFKNHQYVRI